MVFDKKFKIILIKKKDIKFKIIKTGIKANFKIYDYEKNQPINGISKLVF